MTARTQPVTRQAREARRQMYQDLALAQAARKEATMACADHGRHDTCTGLDASTGLLGCLCPCHDKDTP